MLGVSLQISNWELINLYSPSTRFEKEVVWLVKTYVAGVWSEIFIRNGAFLKGDQFFGFLKFKYKAAQLGSRMPLSAIPGIAVCPALQLWYGGTGTEGGCCFWISGFAVGLGVVCAYIDCQTGEQGIVALLVGLILQ